MTLRILLLESNRALSQWLVRELTHQGLDVIVGLDPVALATSGYAPDRSIDAVVVGTDASGQGAIDAVQLISERRIDAPVILTAEPTTPIWVLDVLRRRLANYLVKPIEAKELASAIREAADRARGTDSASAAAIAADPRAPAETMTVHAPVESAAAELETLLIGESPAMRDVRRAIARIAPTDRRVWVYGESGTGKTLTARLIHAFSPQRRANPLLAIHCASVPLDQFESELFGHEAGAATGGEVSKPGRLEMARAGTLVLEDAAALPSGLQERLWVTMRSGRMTRIGGRRQVPFGARLLATSTESPATLLRHRGFRPDLFYLLNEFPIYLPPLRERVEDLPLLVEHFVRKHGERLGRHPAPLTQDLIAAMVRYPWPGNVRELELFVRRLMLTGDEHQALARLKTSEATIEAHPDGSLLERHQVQALLEALRQAQGNQRRAAELLGISYSALRRKLEKHRLRLDGRRVRATRPEARPTFGRG